MRKLGRGAVAIAATMLAIVVIALTVTGHVWALLLFIVVLGPVAFYNRFLNPKRKPQSMLPPCRVCDGYGNNGTCQACGGYRHPSRR